MRNTSQVTVLSPEENTTQAIRAAGSNAQPERMNQDLQDRADAGMTAARM